LRATWRGLETWCGSGPPGHNDAPALDPTCGSRGRATASGDPVSRYMIARRVREESKCKWQYRYSCRVEVLAQQKVLFSTHVA
jgi:hypothetical protein